MEKIIAAVEFFFVAIITLATAGSAIILVSFLSGSAAILAVVSILSVILGGFVLFEKFQESFPAK